MKRLSSSSSSWEIVEDKEFGMLQSLGLQRLGHDLATNHNHPDSENMHLFLYSFTQGFTEIHLLHIRPFSGIWENSG